MKMRSVSTAGVPLAMLLLAASAAWAESARPTAVTLTDAQAMVERARDLQAALAPQVPATIIAASRADGAVAIADHVRVRGTATPSGAERSISGSLRLANQFLKDAEQRLASGDPKAARDAWRDAQRSVAFTQRASARLAEGAKR